MIISQTPFRISFFGGGTDFQGHYNENGGTTLSAAMNKYAYLSIHELSPFFKYKFRASYAKTELVQTPEEFKHPLIRECLTYLDISKGLEITHVADLPGRTGLGTSSSFTVGLLNTLHAFKGETVSEEQLAKEAIVVERERVGDIGGYQDQYAVAYGGLLKIDYQAEAISVEQVALPDGRLKCLQDHLMMFYTGLDNCAQDILKSQKSRAKENTGTLKAMQEIAVEGYNILKGGNDISDFGKLLHETWERKKTLSEGISNTDIDQAYESAMRAGAIGGKLLGAGGRGFLLVFAKPENQGAIRESLASLKEVPFEFSPTGSQIVFSKK